MKTFYKLRNTGSYRAKSVWVRHREGEDGVSACGCVTMGVHGTCLDETGLQGEKLECGRCFPKRNDNKGGRPKSEDVRIPLPFRLKTSVVEKANRLGRDRIEAMIKRAKES